MRHGATRWGEENRFAGWGDTPLSAAGIREAQHAADLLAKSGLNFGTAFTSRLQRARQTLDIVRGKVPVPERHLHCDWRLNERHDGGLQGHTRSDMIARYGNRDVVAWRRSFDAVPPPLADDDPRLAEQFALLPDVPQQSQPRSESMKQAAQRSEQVWFERLAPALREGQDTLVVSHTSSIRGLARMIEGLDDERSAEFRIATAIPRMYVLDEKLAPVKIADLTEGILARTRYWSNWLKPRGLGWI